MRKNEPGDEQMLEAWEWAEKVERRQAFAAACQQLKRG